MKGLYITFSITDTQHNNALQYAECRYAECRVTFAIMLSVIMVMKTVMIGVATLNVIILSVVAPSPLLANVRLGCKFLTLTNTLAYHNTMLKRFVAIGP
jgi:hypothetical protein